MNLTEQYKILLKQKEKELIIDCWLPVLERPWISLEITRGHRTKIKEISSSANEKIHNSMFKLHPVAVMEFLKLVNSFGYLPISVPHIYKGKALLYQLLERSTNDEIPDIVSSSYCLIYNAFWKEGFSKIQDWAKEWMSKLSTIDIRLLYANIYNPVEFSHATVLVDGKYFVQHFSNLDNVLHGSKSFRKE
jgi:hypothetical protein